LSTQDKSAAKGALLALRLQKQPTSEQRHLDPSLAYLNNPKQIRLCILGGVVHIMPLLHHLAWQLQKLLLDHHIPFLEV